MSNPVRLVVVGAGSMGANHVRVARQTAGVSLVALVDPDLSRARSVAGGGDIEVVASINELSTPIDAAVIAVPTPQHVNVATSLASRGVHLLVEKPLARTVADAEAIVEAARAAGIVLAVGHVERFNPVVTELRGVLDSPIHFSATRVSPFTPRIGDGVVLDLMIHDIDIVCSLLDTGDEVVEVSGVSRTTRSQSEDLASVVMRFSSGITAAFNTSRIGQQKVRLLEVTQSDSVVTADLLRQNITVNRMTSHEYLSNDGSPRYRQATVVETPILETRGEPLANQLASFVSSIQSRTAPLVDGTAGLRAVALAERITSGLQSPQSSIK